MSDDQIKERVKYYTEWIRLLWITLIGLSGGISGLLLGLDSPVRVILRRQSMTGYEIFGVALLLLAASSILYLMWQIAKTIKE